MSDNKLKFEFDFNEVFQAIELGAIQKLSEVVATEIKAKIIKDIQDDLKRELNINYADARKLKEELIQSIKKDVCDRLVSEIRKEQEEAFNKSLQLHFIKGSEEYAIALESRVESKAIDVLVAKLKHDIYASVSKSLFDDLITDLRKSMQNMFIANNFTTAENKSVSTPEDYNYLKDRDRRLSALEAGGVDNWEWYSESLANYYENKEE